MATKVEELLTFLAKDLVRKPDEVSIEVEECDGGMRYRMVVGDEDLGRVIGKGGKTAKAFRELGTKLAHHLNEPRPVIEFRGQSDEDDAGDDQQADQDAADGQGSED